MEEQNIIIYRSLNIILTALTSCVPLVPQPPHSRWTSQGFGADEDIYLSSAHSKDLCDLKQTQLARQVGTVISPSTAALSGWDTIIATM